MPTMHTRVWVPPLLVHLYCGNFLVLGIFTLGLLYLRALVCLHDSHKYCLPLL